MTSNLFMPNRPLVLIAAILLFHAATASAQFPIGTIRGAVVDSNNAAVTNANLRLTNAVSGFWAATRTDENGEFVFNNLSLADYSLKIGADGFLTEKFLSEVRSDVPLNVSIKLRVAGANAAEAASKKRKSADNLTQATETRVNKRRIEQIASTFRGKTAYSNGQTTTSQPDEQPLQEVFQTELVYPQEKGEFQITFAPRFSRKDDERTTEFPVRVEYGITNRWQVEAEFTPFSRYRAEDLPGTAKGVGNFSISTKYSFLNIKESDFHSSVQFEVGFPTGDVNQNLSEGFIEYEPSVSFAKDFPRLNKLQVFSQVGVNFVQRIKKPREVENFEPAAHEFKFNAGFFAPFKKARLVGEINWNTDQWNNSGSRSELYLTSGFVYKLPRQFEIGIGTPIGVSRDADNFRVILQVIFEF